MALKQRLLARQVVYHAAGTLSVERLSRGWLAALHWYDPESQQTTAAIEKRASLLTSGRRNSGWKLFAIDFFNEELMRFLSFNNAILSSIEDVIIVCEPDGRRHLSCPGLADFRPAEQ